MLHYLQKNLLYRLRENHLKTLFQILVYWLNYEFQADVYSLEKALGGEIFIPKIPSYKILDVAKAIAPELEHRVVGIRPGEKLHEEMITSSDSFNTVDLGHYFAILPQKSPYSRYSKEDYKKAFNAIDVPEEFSYNSGKNTNWETVESLRELVRLHVDSNFKI